MTTTSYSISGMTCQHCVMSVREEVSEVAGVSGVDVDLAASRMTVRSTGHSDSAIRAAVADAGYEVVA
jgi:copper chaperone CopZ